MANKRGDWLYFTLLGLVFFIGLIIGNYARPIYLVFANDYEPLEVSLGTYEDLSFEKMFDKYIKDKG